jgi:hypothetical protein
VELLGDVGELGRDLGVGIAVFLDEMQDLPAPDLAALCGACHEMSQRGSPVVVVGAGLPHLPTALSASRSYAERLFRYVAVDRLPRDEADRAIAVPAAGEGVEVTAGALDALHALTDGYPYFIQAFGKSTWDHAVQTPITADDVLAAARTPRTSSPSGSSERGSSAPLPLSVSICGQWPRSAGPSVMDRYPPLTSRPRPGVDRRACRRHGTG